jgi:hypothetical protein
MIAASGIIMPFLCHCYAIRGPRASRWPFLAPWGLQGAGNRSGEPLASALAILRKGGRP